MPDGQFYAQQRAMQQWLQKQGVEAEQAAKWTGAVFHCISYDTAYANAHTFDELVEEQTPGGLNEQVLRELTEEARGARCRTRWTAVSRVLKLAPRRRSVRGRTKAVRNSGISAS